VFVSELAIAKGALAKTTKKGKRSYHKKIRPSKKNYFKMYDLFKL